jgi:spore coat protein CotH
MIKSPIRKHLIKQSMMFKKIIASAFLLSTSLCLNSQSLPNDLSFSLDGKMLLTGKVAPSGLYDSTIIREFRLSFPQTNYWTLLTSNYSTRTHIPASLTVDGITLDSVGVSFKGNTSYQGTGTSQKKSFSIKTEEFRDNQDLMGYSTLNLNNAYQDESFLREVFYLHQIRKHIPAAKANFVHLFINEQDWGLYPNVQQLNKDFLEEWFFSNDGANFRAHVRTTGGPGGGGPGGGAQWGDGTAALNYLGADTALYQTKYTLKSSDIGNSWQHLVDGCYELNNTAAADITTDLPTFYDLDRVLWFLASEIAFSDDDSYVFKGKMDYYVYFDPETNRLTPIEFDGNSVMASNALNWGVFYNVTNANYPLLNKLLTVPSIRQRYLAHFRTIIQEEMNAANCDEILDNYKAQIDALVQSDPKKLYTYNQFVAEETVLKDWMESRVNYLNTNTELLQVAPTISSPVYKNSSGEEWEQPDQYTDVTVNASVVSIDGIDHVNLFYSNQLTGTFMETLMYDDGAHNDGGSGDGIFGAEIPGYSAGTYVRFYIEAVSGNVSKSASYLPTGAEHDVFVYQVKAPQSEITGVVINEIMASNNSGATDEAGEFEDWIELYNNNVEPIDLSGFYLSDNLLNLPKWQIPSGTVIPGNGYMIFWADEDSSQGDRHCNFKLSAAGESLMLLDASLSMIDSLNFGIQSSNVTLARVPNGTGNFMNQGETFATNNDNAPSGISLISVSPFVIYPNPAKDQIRILNGSALGDSNFIVTNTLGQELLSGFVNTETLINTSGLSAGIYFLRIGAQTQRFVINH